MCRNISTPETRTVITVLRISSILFIKEYRSISMLGFQDLINSPTVLHVQSGPLGVVAAAAIPGDGCIETT